VAVEAEADAITVAAVAADILNTPVVSHRKSAQTILLLLVLAAQALLLQTHLVGAVARRVHLVCPQQAGMVASITVVSVEEMEVPVVEPVGLRSIADAVDRMEATDIQTRNQIHMPEQAKEKLPVTGVDITARFAVVAAVEDPDCLGQTQAALAEVAMADMVAAAMV
jgi:hypothetical protein